MLGKCPSSHNRDKDNIHFSRLVWGDKFWTRLNVIIVDMCPLTENDKLRSSFFQKHMLRRFSERRSVYNEIAEDIVGIHCNTRTICTELR